MLEARIFDSAGIQDALERVAKKYEKTAPTVEIWADFLVSAPNDQITLSDLFLLRELDEFNIIPDIAANCVYKLNHRLQRTALNRGLVGF